jgi:hypothetical protein
MDGAKDQETHRPRSCPIHMELVLYNLFYSPSSSLVAEAIIQPHNTRYLNTYTCKSPS